MDEPGRLPHTQRPVDKTALERHCRRLSRAARPPWLHEEAGRRMAARLPLLRRPPSSVLDWGGLPDDAARLLRSALPEARVTRVHHDIPAGSPDLDASGPELPWWRPARWRGVSRPRCLDPAAVVDATADLVWSNMALHGCVDPRARMAQWLRALRYDGLLMFSTLGPGNLAELASLYGRLRWPTPMAPLVDMHDLGDMLVEVGFADPVMDQETLTLTWASARALLDELRTLGGNVDPRRHPGLRTGRWRARLEDELAAALSGADGRLSLSIELVYGHAVKLARPPVGPATSISLEAMRSMVRKPR